MKRSLFALLVAALWLPGCAKTTPAPAVAPTPVDYAKFSLAALQTVADSGCKATPQTVSSKACAAIDNAVPQALDDLAKAQTGWKAVVQNLLTQLQTDLPAADYQPIAVYVAVAQAALVAVPAQ